MSLILKYKPWPILVEHQTLMVNSPTATSGLLFMCQFRCLVSSKAYTRHVIIHCLFVHSLISINPALSFAQHICMSSSGNGE